MIENVRRLPVGAVIESDICIVGGGAAGITIAHELARSGRRIVLLAGGERRERGRDRDLHRGEVAPGTSHEPLETWRRRGLGRCHDGMGRPVRSLRCDRPRTLGSGSRTADGRSPTRSWCPTSYARTRSAKQGRSTTPHREALPGRATGDDRGLRRPGHRDLATRALEPADELSAPVRTRAGEGDGRPDPSGRARAGTGSHRQPRSSRRRTRGELGRNPLLGYGRHLRRCVRWARERTPVACVEPSSCGGDREPSRQRRPLLHVAPDRRARLGHAALTRRGLRLRLRADTARACTAAAGSG